ncbi:MAG: hypothetical protein KY434_03495 [Actinobacteria bacterium]|nr:hypothetical protein [Actinomycetota bacterium]
MIRRRRHARIPGARGAAVGGVAVAAVVLAAGAALALARPAGWTAQASMIVLPARDLGPGAEATYYETLSSGQIVRTFSEVVALRRFTNAAADRIGLPADEASQVDSSVQVLPDTAMITVTATAPGAGTAERLADGVMDEATAYLGQLSIPYNTRVVSDAAGTGEPTGLAAAPLLAVVALVASVAGLAAFLALRQLADARLGRAARPGAWPGRLDEVEGARAGPGGDGGARRRG